jgi:hypothetical protein
MTSVATIGHDDLHGGNLTIRYSQGNENPMFLLTSVS